MRHIRERPRDVDTRAVARKDGYGFFSGCLDLITSLPEVREFIQEIIQRRRCRRPGYSPESMLKACVLKYPLGVPENNNFLDMLCSNPTLAKMCGLEDKTPSDSTFSRFFSPLCEREIAPELLLQRVVDQFAHIAPKLGHTLVIDSTDIESYANPRRKRVRDAGANWGIRTAKSKSATRKEKERFFGCKLHLISCANTGMPLTFIITPANANDTIMLEQLVDKALAMYPWMKPKRLLADRGYDSVHNHQLLLNKSILPIIHIRKPPNGGLHMDTYTTIGEPVCIGGKAMEYLRADEKTGKHLYRCPASACDRKGRIKGWSTCMDEVWEDPKENLRALSAVARASNEWNAPDYRALIPQFETLAVTEQILLPRVRQSGASHWLIDLNIWTDNADAGAWDKLRHMRSRVPRQRQLRGV